jgi:outer membrane protein
MKKTSSKVSAMFVKGMLSFCTIVFLTVGANAQKIGYVNAAAILEDLPEYKSATSEFEAYASAMRGKDSVMQVTFQRNYQEVAAKVQQGLLSPKQQEEESKKLEEEKAKIVQFEQTMQAQSQEKRVGLLKPINDKLLKAISDVSKEGAFSYVIDATAGILLYSDDKNDVTNLVRTKLGLGAAAPKK